MIFHRFHHLRATPKIRANNAEIFLCPQDFVLPVFVETPSDSPLARGRVTKHPIKSLPGVFRHSPDSALRKVADTLKRGVNKFLLFGIPKEKTLNGANAYDSDGVVPTVVRALKKEFGKDAEIYTDICLCSYLTSGHCGLLDKNGTLKNDATLKIIQKIALVNTEAGADWVAPSGMCDGAVAAIRKILTTTPNPPPARGGSPKVKILGYSAKFASSFYGPFRDAADCEPAQGDRQTYQLNPANAQEALAEVKADLKEGADAVMVKPAGPYLDIISQAHKFTKKPLYAYQVSGEYASLIAGIKKGWLGREVVAESLLGIKRAGADFIISYFADQVDFC